MDSAPLDTEELEFDKTLAAHPELCCHPQQLSKLCQCANFTGTKEAVSQGPCAGYHSQLGE